LLVCKWFLRFCRSFSFALAARQSFPK